MARNELTRSARVLFESGYRKILQAKAVRGGRRYGNRV